MPYNVIIADDEYYIRQRIKKILPWEELDLQFAGEAENGNEVIQFLKTHAVDILLLDIKMPQMDGMEVAKYVSTHHPHVKIIILSGYNDFEYARVAIRYGVVDYLLKPVDIDTLTSVFRSCTEKLSAALSLQKQSQMFQHYLKCTDISNVLAGNLHPDEFAAKYMEIYDSPFSLYVGCFIFEESEACLSELLARLRMYGCDCEYLKELEYTYTFQFFLKSQEEFAGIIDVITCFISEQTVYIFAAAGETFTVSSPWLPNYKKIESALKERYFSLSSNLILVQSLAAKNTDAFDLSKVRQNIIYYLNSQNSDGFQKYTKTLFEEICTKRSIHFFQLIVSEFFMTYNIYFHDLIDLHQDITDFVSALFNEDYRLENLEETVVSYGFLCMSQNTTTPSDVALCKKIINYIDNNYKDPCLTVARLADVFGLNSSYLGSVFKKVHSQTLLQYMTIVRMEASKALLKLNQYKVSDIADMVGYTDAFYYSKSFKKMYGLSPKNYYMNLGSSKDII